MASSESDLEAQLEAAAAALVKGNVLLAESMCRAVPAVAPEDRAMRENLLGMILAARGEPEAALEAYRRAYALSPDHPGICYNLGAALRARNDAEALGYLKQAVALAPEYAELHGALGEAYAAAGQAAEAIECYRRAVDLDPEDNRARGSLAHALLAAGQLEEALRQFENLLATRPDDPAVLHDLGLLQHRLGRHDRAIVHLRRALEAAPDEVETHYALGCGLREQGDKAGAGAAFERALQLAPDDARLHYAAGELAGRRGDFAPAAMHLRRALELEPDYVPAHQLLGLVLTELSRLDEAAEHLRRDLELRPDAAESLHNGLSVVYRRQGRLDEAEACLRRYLALEPGQAGGWKDLGTVHLERGQLDEAWAHYERALALDPGDAGARWNQARVLLLKGEFAAGWQRYESRRELADWSKATQYPRPEWRGEPLGSRSLLVCAEQGLGDEIMFASILPEIVREARRCTIECSPRLEQLFRRSFAPAAVIAKGAPLPPDVDAQIAMGSVPRHRRRSLEDFPRHGGYLRADEERVAYWRGRLAALGPGRKIGVSWRGGTPRTGAADRSLPLAALLPLLQPGGAHFVSLQYGECREEIESLHGRSGITVHHWQEAIDDYDETAALVTALDLVVSVCTAVVHLSGALGRPAWVMAPFVPEWRYGLTGDTMPWYPSVRLFRQQSRGDWPDVIERVAAALRAA